MKHPHASSAWNHPPSPLSRLYTTPLPSPSAPPSRRQPRFTPWYPPEQPPTSSTTPGAATTPLTSPYPLKKRRTSYEATRTSTLWSEPLPTDSSPPSIAAPPNMPTTCGLPSNAYANSATSWGRGKRKLPTSTPGRELGRPHQDSEPMRATSPALSPWQEGASWSPVSYDRGGTGRSRWWREGITATQSTSLRSSSLLT